jgi:hypothetical protein
VIGGESAGRIWSWRDDALLAMSLGLIHFYRKLHYRRHVYFEALQRNRVRQVDLLEPRAAVVLRSPFGPQYSTFFRVQSPVVWLTERALSEEIQCNHCHPNLNFPKAIA